MLREIVLQETFEFPCRLLAALGGGDDGVARQTAELVDHQVVTLEIGFQRIRCCADADLVSVGEQDVLDLELLVDALRDALGRSLGLAEHLALFDANPVQILLCIALDLAGCDLAAADAADRAAGKAAAEIVRQEQRKADDEGDEQHHQRPLRLCEFSHSANHAARLPVWAKTSVVVRRKLAC